MYSLKCNINLEVNHLSEGIMLALKDDREKNSEALGRPAMYVGESRITKCGASGPPSPVQPAARLRAASSAQQCSLFQRPCVRRLSAGTACFH